MFAFHEAHFSNLSTGHFESHFLRPDDSVVASNSAAAEGQESGIAVEEEYHYEEEYEEGYYDEDDDGLGYYPDGVKRTLTDEQIAIFRHSELEAMRRVRESAKIKKVMDPAADGVAVIIEGAIGEHHHQLSDGEVDSSPREAGAGPPHQQQQGQHQQQQQKKKKKNNNKNKRRGGKKNNNRPDGGEQIDLRKRTWDVVDKGLASLDYGEEATGQPSDERAMQRRRISYDD